MNTANDQIRCGCGEAPKLIFSCSGAADVGKIADLAARKLTADEAGKMYCLAGIGGCVSEIMATTRSAKEILVIDGCPLNCARKTLENADYTKFKHLQLSDIEMQKGKTAVTDENVARVVNLGKSLLAD